MPRVRRRTRLSAQASWSGSSPTTRPSPASSDSVYGIVRVAYDSYYTRLGVFPEAVGLSETTILGRAALYLALTVSVAAFFGGLWLLIVGWSLRGGAQSRRAQVLNPTRLFAAAAVLAATASVVLVAGGVLRSLLGSYHLAYYCVQRCKFAVLTPTSFQQVHDIVVAGKAEHSDYRFLNFGPAWLVVVPVALLAAAAIVGAIFAWTLKGAKQEARSRRALAAVAFGVGAAAALAVGLLAPHLIAVSESASRTKGAEGRLVAAGYIDTHPWFVKWVVFAFVLAAVASILLGSLKLLALDEPSKSPWLIASFIAVLPLLLGFFEPAVPLFVEEEGGAAVTASVLLWATLLLLSFRLLPQIRKSTMGERAMLGILAAIVVSLTLFLAWERGLNLAEKAAMGDQIAAKRFGLLSVRANVVCLDRTERTAKPRLARKPYVYLGETGGTLVLYDYLADLANEKPTAFPLRMPSSGTIVRAAYYNPRGPRAATWVNWDCAKPKT